MSKRNWLRHVAIGGCLIALLLAGSAYAQAISDDTGSQPDTEQTEAAPESHSSISAPTILDAIQSDITRVAAALEAIRAQGEAKDKEEREQSDLNAQWEMAYWAEKMFWATAIQAFFAAIGIGFIWRTLHWTKKAVKEASAATGVARDAVSITKDTAHSELRAYVGVPKAEIAFPNGRPDGEWLPIIKLEIRNSGQTPAKKVQVKATVAVVNKGDIPSEPVAEEPKNMGYLGPGHSLFFNRVPVAWNWIKEAPFIQNGSRVLFVYGRITYQDAFDEDQWTDFKFYLLVDAEGLVDDDFSVCEYGNDAK